MLAGVVWLGEINNFARIYDFLLPFTFISPLSPGRGRETPFKEKNPHGEGTLGLTAIQGGFRIVSAVNLYLCAVPRAWDKNPAREEGTLGLTAIQSGRSILSVVVCPWPRGRRDWDPRPFCESDFA